MGELKDPQMGISINYALEKAPREWWVGSIGRAMAKHKIKASEIEYLPLITRIEMKAMEREAKYDADVDFGQDDELDDKVEEKPLKVKSEVSMSSELSFSNSQKVLTARW